MRPEPDKNASRQKFERRGRRAELIAAAYCICRGFRILARRYKAPMGEIDLIVRRGNKVLFIEVKRRATIDLAIEAVTPRAQHRICKAAAHFFSRNPALARSQVRYDIIAVAPWRFTHIKDAWRETA